MHFTRISRLASKGASQMRAWQVQSPGESLQLKTVSMPILTKPNQVLIKVKAASVNPVDTVMVKGYGREILGVWKKVADCDSNASRFPLIAGRDCSGVVEAIGGGVKGLRPGDEVCALFHRSYTIRRMRGVQVMAVVPAIWPGSHAEYVVTEESCCSTKPKNLDFTQAAAMPYVANTAWAALVSVARMNPHKKPAERVLIHGGSGGLGTMAIQMLKAWGVDKVVVTCSNESAETVRKLGAIPVDYRAADVRDQLINEGPFEVILDCVDTELARWSDQVRRIGQLRKTRA
ncbi:GroES-like protein [Ancylostoma caninum]|uniref:GroES-like protein n=1 Tax=Ancylostoma caninum TaxID=29170 RepID=A0A368GMG4_ANCCA|nr:GroES-like protein [Ancylostoma caninum]